MTEQQPNPAPEHEPQHAVNEPVEPVETPEGAEPVTVEQLQEELAQARTQLDEIKVRGDQQYEILKLRTLEQAAGDVVQAISDMPADDDRYRDDNGMPSAEGMRTVALELVEAKPYLAKARGDVGQGVKDTKPQDTWSDVMRGALG